MLTINSNKLGIYQSLRSIFMKTLLNSILLYPFNDFINNIRIFFLSNTKKNHTHKIENKNLILFLRESYNFLYSIVFVVCFWLFFVALRGGKR